MGGQRVMRRRQRAHDEQDGLCYWCGAETTHPTADCGEQPPHMSTLDHIDQRSSRHRGSYGGEVRTVMSCASCNTGRAIGLTVSPTEIEKLMGVWGYTNGEILHEKSHLRMINQRYKERASK